MWFLKYFLSFTKALQERIQSVTQLASTPKLQKVCILFAIFMNSFQIFSNISALLTVD